jgi:large subunit ribosomal protein L9
MMEIILLERIESLGQMGDVVTVKPGYARNYLLPQKKALRATEENRREFKDKRVQLEADNLEHRQEAEKVGAKLEGTSVTLIRQAGEAGQLYGSVRSHDIAERVREAGFSIDRRQVQLPYPIKSVGVHEVKIDLHPEVSVTVTVNVARSEDEASIQAKTGKAVVSRDEEERRDAEEAQEAQAQADEVFEKGADSPSAEGEDEDPGDEAPGDGAGDAPAGAEEDEKAAPAADGDEEAKS